MCSRVRKRGSRASVRGRCSRVRVRGVAYALHRAYEPFARTSARGCERARTRIHACERGMLWRDARPLESLEAGPARLGPAGVVWYGYYGWCCRRR